MGFEACRLAGYYNVGILFAPARRAEHDSYYSVLNQMGGLGIQWVAIDVSKAPTPNDKTAYAFMRPSKDDEPMASRIWIAGITQQEMGEGSLNQDTTQSLIGSEFLTQDLDEAIKRLLEARSKTGP